MTTEEKQAIIDKALELGFKENETSYFFKIEEQKELWIHVYSTRMAIYILDRYEAIQLRLLTSKEQLETLFNAIVS